MPPFLQAYALFRATLSARERKLQTRSLAVYSVTVISAKTIHVLST